MGGGPEASGDGSVAIGKGVDRSIIAPNATITLQSPIAAPGYSPLHQLPSDLPDFTGRDTEVKDLIAALDRDGGGAAAVSAIRGMGGIGKTTLAVHAARRLLHRYPDAQILVNLQGHSEAPSLTPVEAMAHVVRAFHPEMKAEDDPQRMEAIYRSVLAGQRALIILDNAADTAQVESLLPPPPCGLIVTARDPIPLHGAVPLRLGLLPRGEAVALLRSAARPAEATEEEWDRIAELCDDLPLALRVAGSFLAHAEDCSAADYIADLTDARNRLDHLTVSGTRGDVGAVLAQSARRLAESDPALAALWQCLSVFPADFDRPAAAAVWGIEEKDAVGPLRALLEHGLLLYDGDTKRYRLHDLMRPLTRDVFATVPDQDPSPGSERRFENAQTMFALHYAVALSAADDLYLKGGEGIRSGLALYDRESINILAAADWAIEKMDCHEAAPILANHLPDAGVYVFSLRLPTRRRIGMLEAAVQAAQSLGHKEAEGNHLGNLGIAYAALGETRRAIGHHEQALLISRKIGDRRGEGNRLGNLGNAYADLGETRCAIDHYEQALLIAREIGDRRGEGNHLGNLGSAYAALGETRRAIDHHQQALVISREIGDQRGEGSDLGNLGLAYADLGETRRAIDHHQQALLIAREIGDRRSEGNTFGNLGNAYADLGETRCAIDHHEQALLIAREISNRRGEGSSLNNLGLAYADLGETRRAIDHHEQALLVAREIGDRRSEGNRLGNLGLAYADLGETKQAVDCLEQALAIFEAIESPYAERVRGRLDELRDKTHAGWFRRWLGWLRRTLGIP
ncbi:Transcriptional regulator, AfsR family [Azospirillum argentinense]|uniref:ATP-binding protein n=1 Tax=Azospirillum argentinense TaxID=2970906 RepID=UPI0032DE320C